MGLLQRAVETYDFHQDCVGKIQERHHPLAPIGHIETKADAEITLNAAGGFVSARAVDKDEPKILIPVTEDSGGRSGKNAYMVAHPLCEKLSYLTAQENYYIPPLERWAASPYTHPLLLPILTYVKGNTIASDLTRCGITADEKSLIRWRVITDDGVSHTCWTEQSLFEAYTQYYLSQLSGRETQLCMISGEELPTAKQHPKGVIPINGNAKLISANDSSNFTYRGRFSEDWQAATVGYLTSQKAHNALRWLVAEQGVLQGGRTFLCWNPRGIQVCSAAGPFHRQEEVTRKPSDYREALKKTLRGYRSTLPDSEWVVIAAFDAATTGRLAVTYYNELQGSDFLERLYQWDAHCCWYNGSYGIQSPTLLQLVNGAYGIQRLEKNTAKLVTDERLLPQQLQRLMACRVDGMPLPRDLIRTLVNRASMPQAYEPAVWKRLVFATCAALNQSIYRLKGEDAMSWELDKKDRSFQFGRLLAVLERVEADYYATSGEERQTNAIKALSVFRQRPFHTYEQLNRHLQQAYLPRIKGWQRVRFERCRGEIMEIIRSFPESELDQPLQDVYLMGYDCQRNAFFKKNETNTEEE